MKYTSKSKIPRRIFLRSGSGLMLGSYLSAKTSQDNKSEKRPVLLEELTDKEKVWVGQSDMAKDLDGYFGEGYSCAESILITSLRHLKLPEECVWAAAGFGGGLYHRDLCGFLTGGIMALGFQAGQLEKDRTEAKAVCADKIEEYWKWWQTTAPLECKDIRPPGSSSNICSRLGKLSAAKVNSLLIV